jgi:hypothetical protein
VPRDNASDGYQGKTSISGRGRPALRLAAWRAVWAALPNNPVMAARFAHLTTREGNRLARQQARTACAAALLRWTHVVITRRVTWDPAIATGTTLLRQAAQTPRTEHCCPQPGRGSHKTRARRARTHLEEPTSRMSMASPARLLTELDSRCREQPA